MISMGSRDDHWLLTNFMQIREGYLLGQLYVVGHGLPDFQKEYLCYFRFCCGSCLESLLTFFTNIT